MNTEIKIKQRISLQGAEIIPLSLIARQKFQRYFEEYLKFFVRYFTIFVYVFHGFLRNLSWRTFS
jgi:hypothetical protein